MQLGYTYWGKSKMLKQAYEYGVLLALEESGFVKESGAAHEGAKALAGQAWGGIKRYFTGAGVREALADVAKAQTGAGSGLTAYKPVVDSLKKLIGNTKGDKHLQSAVRSAIQSLEHSVASDSMQTARKKVMKALMPYVVPAAGIGAVAATPPIFDSLYP